MPDKARRTPTYFIQCSLNGIIKSLPLSGGFTWRPSSVCLSVCLSVPDSITVAILLLKHKVERQVWCNLQAWKCVIHWPTWAPSVWGTTKTLLQESLLDRTGRDSIMMSPSDLQI